jgi:protein TonB
MRYALLVSVGIHLAIALLLMVPMLYLGRRVAVSPVYHVQLIEAPAPPAESVIPPAPPPPAPPVVAPPVVKKAPAPPPKPKPSRLPAPAPKPAPTRPAPATEIAPPTPPTSSPTALPTPAVLPKVDAPEFDCADYCLAFQRKIEGQWTPPVSGGEPMQAVVMFTIHRDGEVSGVTLETSSGNFYFDQEAQRAVLLAKPLPPLPRDFLSPTLRVHVTFTWQSPQ